MDYYVTTRNRIVRSKQMPDIADLMNGEADENDFKKEVLRKGYSTTTRKYTSTEYAGKFNKEKRIRIGDDVMFNWHKTVPKSDFVKIEYKEYRIPKKSGGVRIIKEPEKELKRYQTKVARGLYEAMDFAASHTNAFAYVKKRNCKMAIERHKRNKSRWFLKIDLSDFFGSTNRTFVNDMLNMIHPFCIASDIKRYLIPCYLDDTLPQGAPSSPIITNIAMIPIDYEITKLCSKKNLVYTRYSDDMIISGRDKFDYKHVVAEIQSVFIYFGSNYVINARKTRFGSYAGRNFNLGLMYNKDGNITIGHRKKKIFKSQLVDLVTRPQTWTEIQKLNGIVNYYMSIEPDYIKYLIKHYSKKFNVDIIHILRRGSSRNYDEERMIREYWKK